MIKLKVTQLLEEKDKSIYWLSKETGLTYPGLLKLVKNETASIHFETLEKIMSALDIKDFNKILELKEDKIKEK